MLRVRVNLRLSLQTMRLSYFKNSYFIAEKYNVAESVAHQSYFTNKSFRAVCALRDL